MNITAALRRATQKRCLHCWHPTSTHTYIPASQIFPGGMRAGTKLRTCKRFYCECSRVVSAAANEEYP